MYLHDNKTKQSRLNDDKDTDLSFLVECIFAYIPIFNEKIYVFDHDC